MTGRVLGERYELLKRIGGGGMALVYEALDQHEGRRVAVKILRPEWANSSEFVRRFKREAEAAASLNHPNLVEIHDVGQDGETYYIVMELVEGQDLKSLLGDRGPLAPDYAVYLALEILEGLAHAHGRGLVHRDIKPSNILLPEGGGAKVADFGIARATTTNTLTHTGSILGSAHYFSPEQAKGGLVEAPSDLYSLGVVLYELVTGVVPFQGDSPIAVALKHVQATPTLPHLLNEQVPLELETIIMTALAKEPGARYETAEQMAADLNQFLVDYRAGRTHLAPGGEFPTQRLEKVRVPTRPPWQRWGVILVAALLVASLGGWGLGRWLYVPETTVPDLKGRSRREAEQLLDEVKLKADWLGEEFNASVPAGHVIRQLAEPQSRVKEGAAVGLVVSKGAEQFALPNLVGDARVQAEAQLQRLGLGVGKRDYRYEPGVEGERILATNPPHGSVVAQGNLIDLVISQPPIYLKEYRGRLRGEAEDLLKADSIPFEVQEVDSPEPQGRVIEQEPGPWTTWVPGTTVQLKVSRGLPKPQEQVTPLEITVEGKPGGDPVEVEIRVTDATREDVEVYKSLHPPGSIFTFQLRWTGNEATVRVFVNDELTDERQL